MEDTRLNEWFVPKFGSLKFRAFIGMLFLPYTGMCMSFAVWGSLLAFYYNQVVYWDRLGAIALIYFLALGIGAHALDAIGSTKKPWGSILGSRFMLSLAVITVGIAYLIGLYYIISYQLWMLLIVGVLEGFFLLAYNMELFRGVFHNNFWFCISWGFLPALAGYAIVSNHITLEAIYIAIIASAVSYFEIVTSRRYKVLKKMQSNDEEVHRLESRLKAISLSVNTVTICLLIIVATS